MPERALIRNVCESGDRWDPQSGLAPEFMRPWLEAPDLDCRGPQPERPERDDASVDVEGLRSSPHAGLAALIERSLGPRASPREG